MKDRLSLRVRLLLAVAAITLVALCLADVVVYSSLRSYLYNQVDSVLDTSHRAVEVAATNPDGGPSHPGDGSLPNISNFGNGTGFGSSAFCAFGRESAPGMFIEVQNTKGKVVTGTNGKEDCPAFQPGSASYSPKLPTTITGYSSSADNNELTTYFTVSSTATNGPAFRVRASKLSNGEVLIVASTISNVTSALDRLILIEIFVTTGALLAALLLGAWLVRIGLRPLRDVERTAEAIASGDLMHRVPNANTRTEVGHLATAFNVMLERIERLFTDLRSSESRLRRFVGDASHELRTPIAAVSAYAQLFKEGAASRPEDLERVMSGIERESSRMGHLVEDLLTLAKMDEHNLLEQEPFELVGLAIEACDTARLVGPQWPIDFVANDAVEIEGDQRAMRQVIDNLLSNVRAHTPAGTKTTVTVGRENDTAFIEIADNGPGITDEQAHLVFERFFRADPSRSRETGGAGLGLAIVASIVATHGGSVTAAPRPDGGTIFRVMVPVLKS